MELSEPVKRILSFYESDNPGTKANLARILLHGKLGGEIGAIVHNECDVAVLRDRLQDSRGTADRVIVDVLQAQLQARNVAAFKCGFELLGKALRVERGRRDQIEPRRRPRLVILQRAQSFP